MPSSGFRKRNGLKPRSKFKMECVDLGLKDEKRLFEFYSSLPEAISETFKPFKILNREVIREHLAAVEAGRHISVGLEQAPVIIGHGFIMDKNEKHPIFGLGIAGPFQGKGLGRMLMTAVLERAEQQGANHLTLTVVKHNHIALKLYKSYGFEIATEHSFTAENDSYLMVYDRKRE